MKLTMGTVYSIIVEESYDLYSSNTHSTQLLYLVLIMAPNTTNLTEIP